MDLIILYIMVANSDFHTDWIISFISKNTIIA